MNIAAGPSRLEIAVLRGLADGQPFADIAAGLDTTIASTWDAALRLRRRWGARNTAHLITLGYQNNVLTADYIATPDGVAMIPHGGES